MRFKVPDLYHVTKIFGPPGTGKTYNILETLKEKLDYGYAKEDILLVGYSRATAQNLKDRCKKDLNFTDEELEPIQTLHALCKRALPKPEPTLLSKKDKDNFYKAINLPKSQWWAKEDYKKIDDEMDDDEDDLDQTILKKKLDLINKGRSYYSNGDTWESVRYYFDEKQEDYSYGNIERRDLEFTYDTYRDFKKAYSIMDFTDMLTLALKEEVSFKKYKVVFVDECQDLNPLMWAVINKIIAKQGDIYLAGDDDQSIFGFNCGTPELFLGYESHKDIVLDRSYRLPKKILDFSQKIISNISPKFRKEKIFGPKIQDGVEVQGNIIDIGKDIHSVLSDVEKDDWIMCSRTTTKTFDYKKMLMENNILWKTKAKSGTGNSYNYAIKQKVRDTLNIWHKLKSNEKLDGRYVCKLIQEIKSKYLKVKKKDHKPEKSSLFLSDNYYDYNDLVNRNVFEKEFDIQEEWFDYIRFGVKDVQNQTYVKNGQEISLFLDADEAHDYIVEVYKKDQTLMNTKILIGTIHSVKGLEAKNVVICDVWSYVCYKNFREKTPEFRREEIRCAYVAVTRSSENLYMYRPDPRLKIGERSFEILEVQ